MDLQPFFDSVASKDKNGYASVPGGEITLYGTAYALLTKWYLHQMDQAPEEMLKFILDCQDETSGYFVGPELKKYIDNGVHDREHLMMHLTCTVLPVLSEFGQKPKYPLLFAHEFCDLTYLKKWLDKRDLTKAWLEGNNLLFIGQFLVYLRDEEKYSGAEAALDLWFQWLDEHIDPATGLWGTNGYCSAFDAMYGGYHQLLVYYYENRKINAPKALVDTVLSLQHLDGGFALSGGGGACEDVDAVDILVNLYKLQDYRRADIRFALRKCLSLILSIQQPDRGFPYKLNQNQSHMGIPGTQAGKNISTTFATWFRVHTLALIAEVLTDTDIRQINFRFNSRLSMGWHRPWDKSQHLIDVQATRLEKKYLFQFLYFATLNLFLGIFGKIGRLLRKILRK
ncbi:MAG: prenyltransferase/squalene oxidase repeat-containing protein [Saprospiraceae bacterium]